MPNPLSNRKKVRGWPRQIARVEAWSRGFAAIDVDSLLQDRGRVDAKILISPWFRLVRRMPPTWLRRIMVDGLIRVFDGWHSQLESRDRSAYLGIWLVHPHFMESRVVAAVGTEADDCASLLTKAPPLRRFPSELGCGNPPLFSKFDWAAHADQEFVDEDDVGEAGRDGRPVRRGDVWIGTRRTA